MSGADGVNTAHDNHEAHGIDTTTADDTAALTIFRYNPESDEEPHYEDFEVPVGDGTTVLDTLLHIRDHVDSSLSFRHSCRQAVCGSDAMFINGKQRLGCKTQIADLEQPVRIEPLPGQDVRKDLVVDMTDFYERMEAVEPDDQKLEAPGGDTTYEDLEQRRQSPENREKIKLSTRCIQCGACVSSCTIAKDPEQYLGPAAINKAYRFIADEREPDELNDQRMELVEQSNGVWRCQTQFSCTEVCPKDIPLTEHIQRLKRESVKQRLKFW